MDLAGDNVIIGLSFEQHRLVGGAAKVLYSSQPSHLFQERKFIPSFAQSYLTQSKDITTLQSALSTSLTAILLPAGNQSSLVYPTAMFLLRFTTTSSTSLLLLILCTLLPSTTNAITHPSPQSNSQAQILRPRYIPLRPHSSRSIHHVERARIRRERDAGLTRLKRNLEEDLRAQKREGKEKRCHGRRVSRDVKLGRWRRRGEEKYEEKGMGKRSVNETAALVDLGSGNR